VVEREGVEVVPVAIE